MTQVNLNFLNPQNGCWCKTLPNMDNMDVTTYHVLHEIEILGDVIMILESNDPNTVYVVWEMWNDCLFTLEYNWFLAYKANINVFVE